MSAAGELLRKHQEEIISILRIGYAHWDELLKRLERQERRPAESFNDEQIWTFLVSCGYALGGREGVALLTETLTGARHAQPRDEKIWFEVLPISPRQNEGETHLDLALGTISKRPGTGSGIELEAAEASWICFCEMKWLSDISPSVSHDVHRNQLARVIENALCFQGSGRFAERVYVALVTPALFRDARLKSRLYQYKVDDYRDAPSILADLGACSLEENRQVGWSYPKDLNERMKALSFRWVTYDDLFEKLPDSLIAGELRAFWRQNAASDAK